MPPWTALTRAGRGHAHGWQTHCTICPEAGAPHSRTSRTTVDSARVANRSAFSPAETPTRPSPTPSQPGSSLAQNSNLLTAENAGGGSSEPFVPLPPPPSLSDDASALPPHYNTAPLPAYFQSTAMNYNSYAPYPAVGYCPPHLPPPPPPPPPPSESAPKKYFGRALVFMFLCYLTVARWKYDESAKPMGYQKKHRTETVPGSRPDPSQLPLLDATRDPQVQSSLSSLLVCSLPCYCVLDGLLLRPSPSLRPRPVALLPTSVGISPPGPLPHPTQASRVQTRFLRYGRS